MKTEFKVSVFTKVCKFKTLQAVTVASTPSVGNGLPIIHYRQLQNTDDRTGPASNTAPHAVDVRGREGIWELGGGQRHRTGKRMHI